MSLLPSDYIISDDSEQESTEYYFYMFFRTSKVTILHSIDYSIESEKKKTKISSLGNIGSDVMPIAKIRKIKTDDKPKSIREVTEKQKPVTEEKKIEKVDDKVKETVEKKNSLKFILPKPKNSEYLEYTGASKEEKLEEVGEALLVEDKIEIEPEYKSSLPIPGKSKQLNYNSSYKSEIVENNYTVKNYKVDKHFRQFLSNEVEPICISQSELTDMSYNPFSATGTLYSEHDSLLGVNSTQNLKETAKIAGLGSSRGKNHITQISKEAIANKEIINISQMHHIKSRKNTRSKYGW